MSSNSKVRQRAGLEVIGDFVARDFGEDGVFVGEVISCYRDDSGGTLYKVKCIDGDMEDLDQEEYNFAYAFKLQEDGWEPKDAETECPDAVEAQEKAWEPKKRRGRTGDSLLERSRKRKVSRLIIISNIS